MKKNNSTPIMLALLLLVVICEFFSGCSRGFKVEFGVSPVNAIDERQVLTPQVQKVKNEKGY